VAEDGLEMSEEEVLFKHGIRREDALMLLLHLTDLRELLLAHPDYLPPE
jgi:hypothetical protein